MFDAISTIFDFFTGTGELVQFRFFLIIDLLDCRPFICWGDQADRP
jgi:hypothetical protein